MRPILSDDGRTLTVRIPLRTRQRVGYKKVVLPNGAAWAPPPRVDNAMVKALARAFRWRKQLDEGVYGSLDDLARAKSVAPSYVSRVLRLTLLAPAIVEAILDGRQPAELQLDDLLQGVPLDWAAQQRAHRFDLSMQSDDHLRQREPFSRRTSATPPASTSADGRKRS